MEAERRTRTAVKYRIKFSTKIREKEQEVREVKVGDGEDSIISARLLQSVTPAVVFTQPPRAACSANSCCSASSSARPRGQLQQMCALSRDPEPPTHGTSHAPTTRAHATHTSARRSHAHTWEPGHRLWSSNAASCVLE